MIAKDAIEILAELEGDEALDIRVYGDKNPRLVVTLKEATEAFAALAGLSDCEKDRLWVRARRLEHEIEALERLCRDAVEPDKDRLVRKLGKLVGDKAKIEQELAASYE